MKKELNRYELGDISEQQEKTAKDTAKMMEEVANQINGVVTQKQELNPAYPVIKIRIQESDRSSIEIEINDCHISRGGDIFRLWNETSEYMVPVSKILYIQKNK